MSGGTGCPTEGEYSWAEAGAFCMTFVEAAAPVAVLERMVSGCSTGIVSIAEARKWAREQAAPDYGSVIQAGSVGEWAVTVERSGYTATLPEVVRRISKGSRAIVVFRNIDGHTAFLYAVDGVVIRSFDPLLYDDPTPWDGAHLPEESGLDFGNHPMASAFACAERLTGFRVTAALLDDHGDWVAVGHHPLHALSAEPFGPPDKANTERQVCSDDRRAQTTLNRLFFGEEVLDARQIFLPGWIGWVQFLVCAIAAAPVLALRIAAEVRFDVVGEHLDDLSAWQGLLVFFLPFIALVLVPQGLAPIIGYVLDRATTLIGRARKTG